MLLSEYIQRTAQLVRDDSDLLQSADLTVAVNQAVVRYSTDRPRFVVEDVSSVAGGLTLPTPAGWLVGFSAIKQIEYPVGKNPLETLASHSIYQSPVGEEIRLCVSLEIGAMVRLTYSKMHELTELVDTIPTKHQQALIYYAAAECCEQLASFTAGSSDSTIHADSVDYNNASRRWTKRANDLRVRYFNNLGIDLKRNVAFGTAVNMNLNDSRNRDRLFHQGRYR